MVCNGSILSYANVLRRRKKLGSQIYVKEKLNLATDGASSSSFSGGGEKKSVTTQAHQGTLGNTNLNHVGEQAFQEVIIEMEPLS